MLIPYSVCQLFLSRSYNYLLHTTFIVKVYHTGEAQSIKTAEQIQRWPRKEYTMLLSRKNEIDASKRRYADCDNEQYFIQVT